MPSKTCRFATVTPCLMHDKTNNIGERRLICTITHVFATKSRQYFGRKCRQFRNLSFVCWGDAKRGDKSTRCRFGVSQGVVSYLRKNNAQSRGQRC